MILRSSARVVAAAPGFVGGLLLSAAEARADAAPPPSMPRNGSTAGSFVGDVLIAAIFVCLFLGLFARFLVRMRSFRWLKSNAVRGALAVLFTVSLLLFSCHVMVTNIPFRTTRPSEPKSNLGAIRGTEVAYFAEWGTFVGNQPLTPVAERRGRPERVAWNPNTRFSIFGFTPEGNVSCSYSLEGPDWPSAAEGFTARAECDLDGDKEIFTINSGSAEIRRTVSRGPLSIARLRRWLGI